MMELVIIFKQNNTPPLCSLIVFFLTSFHIKEDNDYYITTKQKELAHT